MIEPQQSATYANQLAHAKAAEGLGFSALFRSIRSLPRHTRRWAALAHGFLGHAGRVGSRKEHHPAGHAGHLSDVSVARPLAIAVAQVDEMSAGRIELGLGTGWFEAEHTAYGIPFPPLRAGSIGSTNSCESSLSCGRLRPDKLIGPHPFATSPLNIR
jgi:alkanesulfonate monooxygenase SsuD/methylene tetrahydromethanopterin reductase-like flavin-dependent oxidoreductase (luciferase family)